jgi:hypothetical protein
LVSVFKAPIRGTLQRSICIAQQLLGIRSRLMVEMFPTEFYALAPQKRVISRDTSRPS